MAEAIDTLATLFRVAVAHDKPDAILTRESGRYAPISSREFEQRVARLQLALRALGIGHGDHCAVLSENRWEWPVADFAILSIGAVTVPVYPTLPKRQVQHLLHHSESRIVFCSTGAQQEHRAGLDLDREIARQVPCQSDPVGVAAAYLHAFEPQCVDRTRPLGALRAPTRKRERLLLERNRHVEPAAPAGAETLDGGPEAVRLDEQRVIRDGLTGLGRESPVDER